MKKKGTRRTYTKQISHPYIFVSKNGLLRLSERQDLLQNNCVLLVQEQKTGNNCMSLVQEQRFRDGLSAWCMSFLFPSFS